LEVISVGNEYTDMLLLGLQFFHWCSFVFNTELPKHAPYLVIGAGTAAYAAYRAIRAADATAKVCMYGILYRWGLFN